MAYDVYSPNKERVFIKNAILPRKIIKYSSNKTLSFFGSILEIKLNFIGSQKAFHHNDSVRDLLGLDTVLNFENYSLSFNLVDTLSLDNFSSKLISLKVFFSERNQKQQFKILRWM